MAKNLCLACLFVLLSLLPCAAQHNSSLRDGIRKTYTDRIGVRELTGRNDGLEVERYLNYVWLAKGNPWCAAFVSWSLGQNGIRNARSGGCVQLMEQGRTIYIKNRFSQQPQCGDVFFIYFPAKKRVAHTGFIDKWGAAMVITVEGNTNEAGSREGDGVYRKRRLTRQIYAAVTFIN